ncbi:MAG: peroxiredoxin [Hyphomicrobium sp.]|jgi:peroxiredoxin
MSEQPDLNSVDWSKIPAPLDDGGARHLIGARLPDIALTSTAGTAVSLARLPGRTVLFAYPLTGRPGVSLPEGWDAIPGARGCTPQSCAFRDLHGELRSAGAREIYGISTQSTAYQQEAAKRLHLPFPLLSDADLEFGRALDLPMMSVADQLLFKRLALIADAGAVTTVFYPVFPPDRNAGDVLAWLKGNPR